MNCLLYDYAILTSSGLMHHVATVKKALYEVIYTCWG